MSLVQDLDDDIYRVYFSVVSQLLPHAAEDLGESSLSQALFLKTQEWCFVLNYAAFSELKMQYIDYWQYSLT